METNIIELYRVMSLIRQTEEALLDLFAKNELSGTTHTSIGQEANAVEAKIAGNRESNILRSWSE
jgi:TPP-dependent pyruvate/acetoin dehydrogenase alpha subunit